MEKVIYACDVGSTRTDGKRRPGSGFGWARIGTDEIGSPDITSIKSLTESICQDLGHGRSVALGFECPLFIPIPRVSEHLCTGRTGEGNRAFAAPAGLAVTTMGLQQATWVLSQLVGHKASVRFTVDPSAWLRSEKQVLFCWEAFVSGPAHSDTNTADAQTAARAFARIEDFSLVNDVAVHPAKTESGSAEALSLIGMAALWSGWSTDLAELRRSCVVVKPSTPL